MKILILNGPNLNMLGIREPAIYGKQDYAALCAFIRDSASALGLEAEIRQSNHEGELVTWIQQALGEYDGIVQGEFTNGADHYIVQAGDRETLAEAIGCLEVAK